MRFSEYFVKYDARRDKTTIRPMGVVIILLALVLLLGALFGTWQALTTKVKPVQARSPATATPAPDEWRVRDTGNRPINWTVIKAEDLGGGVVRYALPSEIEQTVTDDLEEILDWWTFNLTHYNFDELAQDVTVYYAEPELEKKKKSIATLQEVGQFGVPSDIQPPPYGLPRIAVDGVLPDGKTVYVWETIGARKMTYYNADGTLIEGSQTIDLPPDRILYRMVFNDKLRRWQIAEFVKGPIELPVPTPAAAGGSQ